METYLIVRRNGWPCAVIASNRPCHYRKLKEER